MKITKELRAAIAAKELERDAEIELEWQANARRRAAIVLSDSELQYALAQGLSEDDARRAKDDHLRYSHLTRTFARAVAAIKKAKDECAAGAKKASEHKAKLEAEKLRRPDETDDAWKSRCRKVDKREKDRVRRAYWRQNRAYLHDCHGIPKPSSYSGTNRGNRRSQKPPAYYRAKEEIDAMKADLLMLEFMEDHIAALGRKASLLASFRGHEWDTTLDLWRGQYEADCTAIRERHSLPADTEDFTKHPEVAHAYAALWEEEQWQPSRHQAYGLWRRELEAGIKEKHGV